MDALKAYISPRMLALGAIGFASGLPMLLSESTLAQWMTDIKVEKETIGLLQLVTLPYVLKALWSPLMDRYRVPLLGPRRGWLLVTQLLLIAAIVGLALTGQAGRVGSIAVAAVIVAVLSASQDIVADGYRTDLLQPAERGIGAAVFVTGYRLAMLATGMGASVLVGQGIVTWSQAYLLMAAVMGIGVIGTLMAQEPAIQPAQPQSLLSASWSPVRELLLRRDGWIVLLFVALFKLPDAMAAAMTVPFLREIGVTNTQLGLYRNGLGMGMTILGAVVGGIVVARLPLRPSLWLFGILQAVSNAGFLLLTMTGAKTAVLIGVLMVENFCAGLFVAGFFAFLMSQCHPQYSVTQYAILSSVMVIGPKLMGAWTGYLAVALGWAGFFLLTIAAAVPALLLLPWITPRRDLGSAEARGFEVAPTQDAPAPA